MNAKTQAAVTEHGKNLLAIFTGATERDPVKLCKKLRRLEREGEALALRLCNGPEYAEGEADNISETGRGETMTIYQQMKKAGVPCQNHESDLYVPVTETTRALVAKYQFCESVRTFQNQVEGGVWFDIPFAFDPYWQKRRDIHPSSRQT